MPHDQRCDSSDIITDYDRGEVFCGKCGEVMVVSLPDWSHPDQYYTQEQFMKRAQNGPSSSLVMYDRGLSTVIGANRDSTGNALSVKTKYDFNRLRIWDKRSKSRSSASLSRAFTLLYSMKTKLAIPDSVVERAAFIYRKIVAVNLTRGRTIASLMTAALYIACRESDIPRTLDELVIISNIEKKVLFRDLSIILKKLDITMEQYDTSSFIVKLSNNMKLSEKTKRMALEILRRSKKKRITAGKHPVAMAAASIYISTLLADEHVTQSMLSRSAGVSDVTIRSSVNLIRKTLNIRDKLPGYT
ncbi:MAG: transcription initiation factor TFIIIB [Cenarchaeum sp. SB0665_bin_23]|nr:transcription initiation factor TFIIIB [Cenarchaeum sp. SB0665_bin_23]MYG32394.1 transcription initiation factor TFIIIB [Cenarchaeum sp. SB0677_bin_16]